jgi:hypothetical protein
VDTGNHLLPSNAEFKNEWSYTSGVIRDKFTFIRNWKNVFLYFRQLKVLSRWRRGPDLEEEVLISCLSKQYVGCVSVSLLFHFSTRWLQLFY